MRIVMLLSLLALSTNLAAQTPAQTPPPAAPPPTQTPAQPRTAKPASRPAQAPARTAMMITATDPTGATLPGIRVDVMGAADRTGETDDSGQLRLANMRAGTYRVRFSGPGVITLEREVVVRAGQTADVDVTLNGVPEDEAEPEPAPEAAHPPAAAAPPVGPAGEPKLISILDLLERDFIGRLPRRETLLGCSGNARSTMIQLNESQPERLYEKAESVYYVLGGEGSIRLNGRESALITGGFAMVPRGTAHAFVRKGRRPLILLAVVSGETCQAAP